MSAARKQHRTHELHPEDPTPTHQQTDEELEKSIELETYDDAYQAVVKGDLPEIKTTFAAKKRAVRHHNNAEKTQKEIEEVAEQRDRYHKIGKSVIETRGKIVKEIPLKAVTKKESRFIRILDALERARLNKGAVANTQTESMLARGLDIGVSSKKSKRIWRKPARDQLKKDLQDQRDQGEINDKDIRKELSKGMRAARQGDYAAQYDDAINYAIKKRDRLSERAVEKKVEKRNEQIKKSMALELTALEEEARPKEVNSVLERLDEIESKLSSLQSLPNPSQSQLDAIYKLKIDKYNLTFYLQNIDKDPGERKSAAHKLSEIYKVLTPRHLILKPLENLPNPSQSDLDNITKEARVRMVALSKQLFPLERQEKPDQATVNEIKRLKSEYKELDYFVDQKLTPVKISELRKARKKLEDELDEEIKKL